MEKLESEESLQAWFKCWCYRLWDVDNEGGFSPVSESVIRLLRAISSPQREIYRIHVNFKSLRVMHKKSICTAGIKNLTFEF